MSGVIENYPNLSSAHWSDFCKRNNGSEGDSPLIGECLRPESSQPKENVCVVKQI
jgi:hypothetical protein